MMRKTPATPGRHQDHGPAEHGHDGHAPHRDGHCPDRAEDARKPGRPRSEAAEKSILDAAIDLLGEGVPYSVLSVEQIAARAGVGKATIYRRWANKQELIIGALKLLQDGCVLPDLQDDSTTRDRIVLVLEAVHANATGERSGLVFNTVMAEAMRYPDFIRHYQSQVVEPRREIIRTVLRAGVTSGELRADLNVERAMRMLVAPLLMILKMEGPDAVMPDGFIAGLVDDLLQGLAA